MYNKNGDEKMIKEIMNEEQLSRTLKRMTHEIIERNQTLDDIVFVGILKKGFPVAEALNSNFKNFTGIDVPIYGLDITPFRDDVNHIPKPMTEGFDIKDKRIILVDDVLYTGRSVRAALDALINHGRPALIQLAILIDRGHRELPIRADYIGKNIPTSKEERIKVDMQKKTIYIESSSE
jgi:pyrimidine operon attenuation protein / uracil phosphoribosyltransferase